MLNQNSGQFFDSYIRLYAEKEARLERPAEMKNRRWSNVLVVPVHREGSSFFRMLQSLSQVKVSGRVLAVLVLNEKEDDPGLISTFSHELVSVFGNDILDRIQSKPLTFVSQDFHLCWDALVVNRAYAGFTFGLKEGVGLARKIGCDLALSLIRFEQIASSWIRTTDADALLPDTYFAIEKSIPFQHSAFVVPFQHIPSEVSIEALAMRFYDDYLQSYVDGLNQAESPYAFHSVGSTIGVDCGAYAAVRGFPKRLAGEDFYLLNKLAKVNKGVYSLTGCEALLLEGRLSNRVPFGTGASLIRIVERLKKGQALESYDSQIFHVLKELLKGLRGFSRDVDLKLFRSSVLESVPSAIRSALESYLDSELCSDLLKVAVLSPLPERRLRHLMTHFDGFRTLKFVHFVRDQIAALRPSYSCKKDDPAREGPRP